MSTNTCSTIEKPITLKSGKEWKVRQELLVVPWSYFKVYEYKHIVIFAFNSSLFY
ncbi:hypothetical protein Hdeb2414_s0016g00469701 [Helianthus debilis subsp. tardiflorus]